MEREVTNGLRNTFLVHMIIFAVLGAALWLVPGRTLTFVGWVPETARVPGTDLSAPGSALVDPFLTRLLGAALLALALSSYRGWLSSRWSEVASIVQVETVFHILALVAFLVPGLFLNRGRIGIFWVISVVLFAGFSVLFGLSLRGSIQKA